MIEGSLSGTQGTCGRRWNSAGYGRGETTGAKREGCENHRINVKEKTKDCDVEKTGQTLDSDGILPDVLGDQTGYGGSSRFLRPHHFQDTWIQKEKITPPHRHEHHCSDKTDFYEDSNLYEFKRLEDITWRYVILDSTAFYARAGGRSPTTEQLTG